MDLTKILLRVSLSSSFGIGRTEIITYPLLCKVCTLKVSLIKFSKTKLACSFNASLISEKEPFLILEILFLADEAEIV